MDVMARRSLLLTLGGNDMKPWKTIVLTENRATDSVATMSKWVTFLGIDSLTDLDDYIYAAVFVNNTQGSYPAELMAFTNVNNVLKYTYIRSGWAQTGINNASVYANAGTKIDVYRLPK